MNALFLAWRHPIKRSWYPVGKLLKRDDGQFEYCYLRGVEDAMRDGGFVPFPTFPYTDRRYVSTQLFPLFSNRIMQRRRPDYAQYTEWLNIPASQDDPIALLARSGGERLTDTLELFPEPHQDEDGTYHLHFFAHGISHMTMSAQERVYSLVPGDPLRLMRDFQNPVDPNAIVLRTAEDIDPGDCHSIGYLPRYLANDICNLLQRDHEMAARNIHVEVSRVNGTAPPQFRLLCCATIVAPPGFRLYNTPEFQLMREDFARVA